MSWGKTARRADAVAAIIVAAAIVQHTGMRNQCRVSDMWRWHGRDCARVWMTGVVALDHSIDDADGPMGVSGHLGIVRHQNDGDSLGVELLEHPQDFDARVRIEIAGGFVGQHQRGTVDQSAADGHPLLLSPGHLRRHVIDSVGQSNAVQQSSAPNGVLPGPNAAVGNSPTA